MFIVFASPHWLFQCSRKKKTIQKNLLHTHAANNASISTSTSSGGSCSVNLPSLWQRTNSRKWIKEEEEKSMNENEKKNENNEQNIFNVRIRETKFKFRLGRSVGWMLTCLYILWMHSWRYMYIWWVTAFYFMHPFFVLSLTVFHHTGSFLFSSDVKYYKFVMQ